MEKEFKIKLTLETEEFERKLESLKATLLEIGELQKNIENKEEKIGI